MDHQHPGILPALRQLRPQHAQSVQGGAAAADAPVARIRYGEVQRFGDLALMLPGPDLLHVPFGLPLGAGGEDHRVPPRSRGSYRGCVRHRPGVR